jgi:Ca-activated chloride channel family protein
MIALNSISFLWPQLLWLLCILPLLCGIYLFTYTRYHHAQTFGQPRLPGPKSRTRWRNAVVAALVLLGLALFILSLARPRAALLLPTRLDSVMVAIDTSGSMAATDIAPSRIEAAQATIKKFIGAQPPNMKVGVVTIASTAAIAQAPTTDRDDLYRTIESLPLQAGSAVGSGILIALSELIPGSGLDVQKILTEPNRSAGPTDSGQPLDLTPRPKAALRVAPGSNKSAAIVLISDGQSNFGPDPLKMAQLAADFGVRIYTVGMGTPEGVVLKAQGVSMRVKLDEALLKNISELTLGNYYRATSDTDLTTIYQSLSKTIRLERHQVTEVSAIFLALSVLFLLIAALISINHRGRII